MRDVLLLFGMLPIGAGTAGAMGRIDEVRLGGLPGVSAFWRALSSQEDLVGDQRLREGGSVVVVVVIEGGVGDLSKPRGVVWSEEGECAERTGGEVGGDACVGRDLCCGGIGIVSSTVSLSDEMGLVSSSEIVEMDFEIAVDDVLRGIDFSCRENSDFKGLALLVELTLPAKSR